MRELDELAESTIASRVIEPTAVAVLRARAARQRNRRITVSVGVLIVAVALAAPLVFRATDDSRSEITTQATSPAPRTTIPDLPAGVPQPTPAARAHVPDARSLVQTVEHDGTLWAIANNDMGQGRLLAYDTETGKRTGSVRLRPRYIAVGIAAGGSSVWVLAQRFDGSPYVVSQIDPARLKVHREVELPGPGAYGATERNAIVASADAVWLGVNHLYRVDAASGAVSEYPTPPRPELMAADRTSLWMVFGGDEQQLWRLDFATDEVVHRGVIGEPGFPGFPWSMAVDDGAAWVTANAPLPGGGTPALQLFRIDAASYATASFTMPAVQVATGEGQVWVQLYDAETGVLNRNGLVALIDPENGAMLSTIRTPLRGPPFNGPTMSIGHESIWIGGTRIAVGWAPFVKASSEGAPTPSAPVPASPAPSTPGPTASGPTSTAGDCTVAQLEVALHEVQGSGGQGIAGVLVQNTSDAPCHLRGTPSIDLVGDNGQTIPTTAMPRPRLAPGTSEGDVSLSPAETARFDLTWIMVRGAGSCDRGELPPATALRVTLPGVDTLTIPATAANGNAQPIVVCGNEIQISPVYRPA